MCCDADEALGESAASLVRGWAGVPEEWSVGVKGRGALGGLVGTGLGLGLGLAAVAAALICCMFCMICSKLVIGVRLGPAYRNSIVTICCYTLIANVMIIVIITTDDDNTLQEVY